MEDAKLRIFGAIDEVMSMGGITAVTMSAVASHCGMFKGNLLYYFDSKEEMLHQYFAYSIKTRDDAFFVKMDDFLASHDRSPESLEKIISMLLDLSLTEPSMRDVTSISLLSIATHDDYIANMLDAKYDRYYDYCTEKLRDFVPAEQFDEHTYIGLCSELFLNILGILYLNMSKLKLPSQEELIIRTRKSLVERFLSGSER